MTSMEEESRGIPRLLHKLTQAIDLQKFYEAHQLMRTINFRYRSSNKIPELEQLLIKTSNMLLDKEQYESGSDVANMLTKLYLENGIPITLERIEVLTTLLEKMQDTPERAMFIGNTMEWSSNSLELCGKFNSAAAQIYIKQGACQEAWKHVIRMTDPHLISKFTEEIIRKNSIPMEETDLVVSILILTLISAKKIDLAESVFTQMMKSSNPSIPVTPLLNGVRYMMEASKTSDAAIYKSLKKIYWPSFNREPTITRLVNVIGKIIFKIQPTNQNSQRNGLMANLFNALAQPDSPQGQQPIGGSGGGAGASGSDLTLD